MPGRMESVENLSRQQYRVRGAVDGFPPFPPPLGNRYAIPTVPQPRRRRYLSYEQETQGDTSIELPRGTFLLGVDKNSQTLLTQGHPVWHHGQFVHGVGHSLLACHHPRERGSMSEPFLAEVRIVGFNFAPRGWALCDGQILPINQNQSLYSLLGTTYGGDGRTSFALPDLRGRTPIHVGS